MNRQQHLYLEWQLDDANEVSRRNLGRFTTLRVLSGRSSSGIQQVRHTHVPAVYVRVAACKKNVHCDRLGQQLLLLLLGRNVLRINVYVVAAVGCPYGAGLTEIEVNGEEMN